jgi:hypothetical protein
MLKRIVYLEQKTDRLPGLKGRRHDAVAVMSELECGRLTKGACSRYTYCMFRDILAAAQEPSLDGRP